MKNETENPDQGSRADENGSVATEAAPAPETVQETTPNAEELQQLKEKAAKADEYWARLLREAADFENYKKRMAREKQDAVKYANEGLLQKLIPIIDNFDMAMAASTSSEANSVDSLKKGIEMIHTLLKSNLADAGLEEIDATNKKFDPNFHEAVSQKETTDVPEGQVVQQLRKGYRYRDRLIRPATVIVAKKP